MSLGQGSWSVFARDDFFYFLVQFSGGCCCLARAWMGAVELLWAVPCSVECVCVIYSGFGSSIRSLGETFGLSLLLPGRGAFRRESRLPERETSVERRPYSLDAARTRSAATGRAVAPVSRPEMRILHPIGVFWGDFAILGLLASRSLVWLYSHYVHMDICTPVQFRFPNALFVEICKCISGISRAISADRSDTLQALSICISCFIYGVSSRGDTFWFAMRIISISGFVAFRPAQACIHMLFRVLITFFWFILLSRACIGLGGSFEIG